MTLAPSVVGAGGEPEEDATSSGVVRIVAPSWTLVSSPTMTGAPSPVRVFRSFSGMESKEDEVSRARGRREGRGEAEVEVEGDEASTSPIAFRLFSLSRPRFTNKSFDSSIVDVDSPLMTAPNQTLDRSPRRTSPATVAEGATNAADAAEGMDELTGWIVRWR